MVNFANAFSPDVKLGKIAQLAENSLSLLDRGHDPLFVAKHFVDHSTKINNFYNNSQSSDRNSSARMSPENLFDTHKAALGLYASVFKLGLNIAFGQEPNQALNDAFHGELRKVCQPNRLNQDSLVNARDFRPWLS